MKIKKSDTNKCMLILKVQALCMLLFQSLVVYQNSFVICPTTQLLNEMRKKVRTTSTKFDSELIKSEDYGSRGCPRGCGCWKSRRDCPLWYSVEAVKESAMINDPATLSLHSLQLAKARESASTACNAHRRRKRIKTGWWCLAPDKDGTKIDFPDAGISYRMAKYHSPPSTRIVSKLVDLFRGENVESVNDFGAGIGQYKSSITKQLPNLRYDAYDGAGNGEEYTKGMIKYVDLTVPLNLPVADWVISLEVGEHIPNKFEGMFIRNLHRHNRKGVILSWAVPGQGGHEHVNNHSNDYVTSLFESLGYRLDSELTHQMRKSRHNHPWFAKSVYVFRKH